MFKLNCVNSGVLTDWATTTHARLTVVMKGVLTPTYNARCQPHSGEQVGMGRLAVLPLATPPVYVPPPLSSIFQAYGDCEKLAVLSFLPKHLTDSRSNALEVTAQGDRHPEMSRRGGHTGIAHGINRTGTPQTVMYYPPHSQVGQPALSVAKT